MYKKGKLKKLQKGHVGNRGQRTEVKQLSEAIRGYRLLNKTKYGLTSF